MGIVLWHKLSLDGVTVTNDIYGGGYALDVGVEVRYGIGEAPTFTIEVLNLPLKDTKSLSAKLEAASEGADGGVPATIELGYFDGGPKGKVLEGRIDRIEVAVRDRPVVTILSGHELAGHKLLRTTKVADAPSPPAKLSARTETPLPALVETIRKAADIPIDGKVEPADVTFKSLALDGENALDLLEKLADDVGAEWYVQDGKLAFGTAIESPMPGPIPAIPNPAAILKLLGGGDTLVALASMTPAPLAKLTPLTLGKPPRQRATTDVPPAQSVGAFDFIALGAPGLRAGQLVSASIAEYASPFEKFRILSVTHRYSREGYTCTGRAAQMAPPPARRHVNRDRTKLAREASAASVAVRISERGKREQALRPSVDVGRLSEAKSADRAASFRYGQETSPTQASPSIDADIPDKPAQLIEKPVASPFAWHKVGLSVPLYPGMRALLAQVRDVREDAVAAGFLWANTPKMERPASKDGDWWLCLPTELGGDGMPTGKGVNDLTARDGRRVIEAKGLLLKVGDAELTAVGSRPTEGAADEFEIRHGSGATVKIASDGAVTVQAASGKSLTLTDGATKVEIGGGTVKVE